MRIDIKAACLLLVIACTAIFLATNHKDADKSQDYACYQRPPSAGSPTCTLRNDQLFRMLAEGDQNIESLVFDTPAVIVHLRDGRTISLQTSGDNERAAIRELAIKAQANGAPFSWATQLLPPPPSLANQILMATLSVLVQTLPIFLIIGLSLWLFMRSQPNMKNMLSKMGTARTKNGEDLKQKVRFSDIAGLDEAKEELQDVISYLKDPDKAGRLGAKPARGLLLIGPPGNGKTILARAVAGEAGVPFLSISGSDFVQMFAGVGASRVRELFDQARKNAPSIIFIDEIDAVGRQRSSGASSAGHDEREQTLNQLLVEMDGFDNDGPPVEVIAATNRVDILDAALVRSGRFDKKITIPFPDLKAREALFKLSLDKLPEGSVAADVNINTLARGCAGMSSSDLSTLVNQAAVIATREDSEKINTKHLESARDRLMMGEERKSAVLSPQIKRIVSYHEGGHAIVGYYSKHHPTLQSLTCIPRGPGLGVTLFLPEDDQPLVNLAECKDRLACLMAGRVAEEMLWSDGGNPDMVTSGAMGDIDSATKLASRMVREFGFSGDAALGLVNYTQPEMSAPFSENTLNRLEGSVRKYIEQAYATARSLIEEHKVEWAAISEALIEKETLSREETETIMQAAILGNA